MAIVSIHDEAFLDIYFNLGTLLSPGDVGNSGQLLPLPVRLSIWHLL